MLINVSRDSVHRRVRSQSASGVESEIPWVLTILGTLLVKTGAGRGSHFGTVPSDSLIFLWLYTLNMIFSQRIKRAFTCSSV